MCVCVYLCVCVHVCVCVCVCCVCVCVCVCVCTMYAECCCHVILISVQFSSSMLKLRKVKYNHILKGRKASKVSYMRVRSTGIISEWIRIFKVHVNLLN